ncbi:hypothetical protein CB1_001451006 [Camelus ferus]|nr:hypothetical protein CB1_001451006 [Camelus ferus]
MIRFAEDWPHGIGNQEMPHFQVGLGRGENSDAGNADSSSKPTGAGGRDLIQALKDGLEANDTLSPSASNPQLIVSPSLGEPPSLPQWLVTSSVWVSPARPQGFGKPHQCSTKFWLQTNTEFLLGWHRASEMKHGDFVVRLPGNDDEVIAPVTWNEAVPTSWLSIQTADTDERPVDPPGAPAAPSALVVSHCSQSENCTESCAICHSAYQNPHHSAELRWIQGLPPDSVT